MYVRITTVTGLSEAGVKEAVKFFEEEDLPVLEEEPGFCGALIMAGVMNNRDSAMGLTLWQTRRDIRTSREKEYEARKKAVETSRQALEGRPPEVKTYEVLVEKLGGLAKILGES
jgi:hypothetical protein